MKRKEAGSDTLQPDSCSGTRFNHNSSMKNVELQKHQKDWEFLSEADPLWSILTDPSAKGNKWETIKFFETGKEDVEKVISEVRAFHLPGSYDKVLDFGCGVGRLCPHFLNHFNEYYGVDVAERMIQLAKQIHADRSNCSFLHNPSADLQLFDKGTFDLIYSGIVFQHMPNTSVIFSYIQECLRVLKPTGVFVFQLPTKLPLVLRFHPKRKCFKLLSALGFSKPFLHHHFNLNPIQMRSISEDRVADFLREHNSTLQKILHAPMKGPFGILVHSNYYFVTKNPAKEI